MSKQRLYLRHKNKEYRVFELNQTGDKSLYINLDSSVYFPRDLITSAVVGDELVFQYDEQEEVDHFSLHAKSGQMHVKKRGEVAKEPYILERSTEVIPLATVVAPVPALSLSSPSSDEKWIGLEMQPDSNYAILDIFYLSKNVGNLQFNFSGFTINNDKMSNEGFYTLPLVELDTTNILITCRTSSHDTTVIDKSIIFRQQRGKTINIKRVTRDSVLAQVSEMEIR